MVAGNEKAREKSGRAEEADGMSVKMMWSEGLTEGGMTETTETDAARGQETGAGKETKTRRGSGTETGTEMETDIDTEAVEGTEVAKESGTGAVTDALQDATEADRGKETNRFACAVTTDGRKGQATAVMHDPGATKLRRQRVRGRSSSAISRKVSPSRTSR